MKAFKKTLALFLVLVFSFSFIPKASAITYEEDSFDTFYINEIDPILGNDFILEQVEVTLSDQVIIIRRTIYSDNRMVVEITENGVTQSNTYYCDYYSVRSALEQRRNAQSEISTFDRYAGYSYELLKIDTNTYYYSPSAMEYYTIFNELSAAFCEVWWFSAATIATIAAIIAQNSYREVETKIVVTEYWYLETSSGQFVSYLCEYVATTYIETSPNVWEYAGVASGDYNTLYM